MSASPPERDAEPCGTAGGRLPLSIRQPARGYRFSIDAVLLADFAASCRGERVLDLGTGSGVVLLLLSRLCPSLRTGVGVEIQQELHEFAMRNFHENGLAGRLAAVRGDFRERLPGVSPRAFDLVVSNPPFRRVGEGRRNPDAQKEIARHEVTCTLTDLFRAAGRHLSPKGRFALVGLTQRLPEIFSCAEAERIFPETLRFIHPYPGRPAGRVLFAGGRRKPPRFSVLPPLVIYSGEGRYHPEVERIYSGMLKMQEGKPRPNK